MKLINVHDLCLVDTNFAQCPPYAILSHTWEADEVSYQEMSTPSPATLNKRGYHKIQRTCEIATEKGFEYLWVDTCCIDKTSSAELSEAINSMFNWYANATICLVYLSDLSPNAHMPDDIDHCRWFTRGWTLQELIAPAHVVFYNSLWAEVGSKASLLFQISRRTGINTSVLDMEDAPEKYTVATRMTWAANRDTSRPEDIAYCLLGLFKINMPLLYGEGNNAFKRLQEEIIKALDDPTILLWQEDTGSRTLGLVAPHPRSFKHLSGKNLNLLSWDRPEFSISKTGLWVSNGNIKIMSRPKPGTENIADNLKPTCKQYELVIAGETTPECYNKVGVRLRKVGPKLYHYEGFVYVFTQLGVIPHVQPMKESARRFHIIRRSDKELADMLFQHRHYALYAHDPTPWRIFRTCPTDSWDYTDEVFLMSNPLSGEYPGTVRALLLANNFRAVSVQIIVLCIYDGENWAATIVPSKWEDTITQMLFNSSYTEEGVNRFLLTAHLPQLATPVSSKLRFQVRDHWFEIKASIERSKYVDGNRAAEFQLHTKGIEDPSSVSD